MAATALRHAYVGVVGDSFEGMGDFAVLGEKLKDRFGCGRQGICGVGSCRVDTA